MEKIVSNFWTEVKDILLKYGNSDLKKLTDLIYKVLKKYFDNNISVEITRNNNFLEILLCGTHNSENINFIKKILEHKPVIKNVNILGPKPGLGFEFTININGKNIEASKILFYPLKSNENSKLGISIYLNGFDNISEEILWKIIETGIGEEKASYISHLEFTNNYDNDSLEIKILNSYIDWFISKNF